MIGHGKGHWEEFTIEAGFLIWGAGWMEKLCTKIGTLDMPLHKGPHLISAQTFALGVEVVT